MRFLVKTLYKHKRWNHAVISVASIIVFITTYMMILPAVTLTKHPLCGLEEHVHTAECYSADTISVLNCPYANTYVKAIYNAGTMAEPELIHYADTYLKAYYNAGTMLEPELVHVLRTVPICIHTHDERCYDASGQLICPLPERQLHVHTAECYPAHSSQVEDVHSHVSDGNSLFSDEQDDFEAEGQAGDVFTDQANEELRPICGKEELILHVHTSECYDDAGNLICNLPEVIEHQHTDACFEQIPQDPVLICGKIEHVHTDACYAPQDDPEIYGHYDPSSDAGSQDYVYAPDASAAFAEQDSQEGVVVVLPDEGDSGVPWESMEANDENTAAEPIWENETEYATASGPWEESGFDFVSESAPQNMDEYSEKQPGHQVDDLSDSESMNSHIFSGEYEGERETWPLPGTVTLPKADSSSEARYPLAEDPAHVEEAGSEAELHEESTSVMPVFTREDGLLYKWLHSPETETTTEPVTDLSDSGSMTGEANDNIFSDEYDAEPETWPLPATVTIPKAESSSEDASAFEDNPAHEEEPAPETEMVEESTSAMPVFTKEDGILHQWLQSLETEATTEPSTDLSDSESMTEGTDGDNSSVEYNAEPESWPLPATVTIPKVESPSEATSTLEESAAETTTTAVFEDMTETTSETAVEIVSAAAAEEAVDIISETTTEASVESSSEATTEAVVERASETTTEAAVESVSEATTEAAVESASETTSETASEPTSEAASETSSELISEKSTEMTTETATESFVESSTEATTEYIAESFTEATTEYTAESSTEATTEYTAESSTEATTEYTAESSTETTTASTQESSTEATTEFVAESSTETTTEYAAESSTEATTEYAAESSTETTTEYAAESSTETTTECAAESSTETTTEYSAESSEATTEITTEASSEATTEYAAPSPNVMDFRGADYSVHLTYDESAGLPEGSALAVREIVQGTAEYDEYLAHAKQVLGLAEDSSLPQEYARFFDITIIGPDGFKAHPSDRVKVEIIYDTPVVDVSADNVSTNVLHFDRHKNPEVIEALDPSAEGVPESMADLSAAGITEGTTDLSAEGAPDADDAALAASFAVEDASSTDTFEEEPTDDDGYASAAEGGGSVSAQDGLFTDKPDDIFSDGTSPDDLPSGASGIPSGEIFTESECDSVPDAVLSGAVQAADPDAQYVPDAVFMSDSFSVFGIIYTVDFHYEVDGEIYDYSISGGSYISFYDLAKILHIVEDDETTLLDEVQKFVDEIENMEVSDSELFLAVKVPEYTTIGELKSSLGLESEYTAELTKEEIAAINDAQVKAGDWVLLSLKPFLSLESLIITMKNGSVFTINVTDAQLRTHVITADGKDYLITVTYGPETGIPEDAVLEASEILQEDHSADDTVTEYEEYAQKAREALGWEDSTLSYARFFDISILDKDDPEVRYQPAEGTTVDVKVELADSSSEELSVVHFADSDDTGSIVESTTETVTDGQVVSFKADGFSVYAILDESNGAVFNTAKTVKSAEELAQLAAENQGLYIAHADGYYFTKGITNINGTRQGITKTKPASNSPELAQGAVLYWFQPVDGAADTYYVYCREDDQSEKYIRQKNNSMSLVTEKKDATPFKITEKEGEDSIFLALGTDGFYWNMQAGANGKSFAAFNSAGDVNARMKFQYIEKMEDDPYKLDGRTTGIVYDSESLFCTALMQDSSSANVIASEDMIRLDTKGYEDNLFVPIDIDITEWTFHNTSEDRYLITTGDGKYLTINKGSVTLSDEPTEKSLIRVVPGANANRGCFSFTSSNGYTLAMTGSDDSRAFTGVTGNPVKKWFRFAVKSNLSEDDYLIYTAKKLSVSDTVDQVVLYTRVWNEDRYDFYTVDYDGSLIRCYDEGDMIQWVGNQFETTVWELTEHTKLDENGSPVPNGYYELKNTYSGQYIQPQLADGSLFSAKEAYLNLDGRYYQEDYTTIKCWDDAYYSYMGLKVDLENNRVVPCPSAQADDFYFARIKKSQPHLTEVETVDNNDFGITMKMIDFNNPIVSDRDSGQSAFFGRDSDKTGLVTTDIKENGYPVSTYNNTSLKELFKDSVKVNQLFIQSVYDESGYFEYDSTKNFAYLNGTEFEVYDQLGTVERDDKNTMYHGQFMPYNSLINPKTEEPWPYSEKFTYKTTVTGDPLPEEDSRYGEGLHEIPKSVADYFFGMEMSAKFTQTPSGLDAWGHDIIFEFSGDDDFWFFVDNELVLDLGGVHTAMTGSVNFRTGMITQRRGKNVEIKSLRDVFRSNYLKRNPKAGTDEVNLYLDRFFENGGTVFKDYSTHAMNIFYMERGAGASNLHMRFNLTAVKPGEITLSKKVTGSDDIDYDLMEFPYKVLYHTKDDSVYDDQQSESSWRELVQNEAEPVVTYKGSKRPVRFAANYTPTGDTKVYSNVFFLKPGESASITMPDDIVDYKIVECGVNMNIFKSVKANSETLSGEEDTGHHDYETPPSSLEERSDVEFENQVDPDSLRTLTITKVLWDEAGFTVTGAGTEDEAKEGTRLSGYDDDETTFNFRISMSSQDSASLVPTRNKKYYVRDPLGNYCRWDADSGRFVSLEIQDFTELAAYISGLSDLEKSAIIFETSNSGGISKIPGGYSIEFRGLPVDSSFEVNERPDEIPAGYSLVEFERDKGSYISSEEPNQGTIRANQDPHILVHNKRGWGLTVNKVWSDADYMESHDDIYFAVYVKDSSPEGSSLLEGTVRRLSSPAASVYYYFDELPEGTSFEDYQVYEVRLTNPQTGDEGKLVYDDIERIEEGSTLTVGGQPKDKVHQEGFSYEVSYTVGEPFGGRDNVNNVRVDTVTNTRQGIKLVKTDWNGNNLPGAVFTLKDADGDAVGADSFTSDENGLITIAYLDPNTEYILEETTAPNGFSKPSSPWKISVGEENAVTVDGEKGSFEIVQTRGSEMAVIILKNKGFSLEAIKVGKDEKDVLEDAVFALYKQVQATSGDVKDQRAIPGFEKLTTGSDGVIPKITSALPEGVYYLSEVAPPKGYKKLAGDLVFTIDGNGTVSIPQHVSSADPDSVIILNNLEKSGVDEWISSVEENGHVTYTVHIPNDPAGIPVRFLKIDQTGKALQGAEFSIKGDGIDDEEGLVSTIKRGESDAVIYSNEALPVGEYTLTETDTPTGYISPEKPVIIRVENTRSGSMTVSASIDGKPFEYPMVSQDLKTGVWTVKVPNQVGYELPATGGPGTDMIYLIGFILTLFAGIGLTITYRRRNIAH